MAVMPRESAKLIARLSKNVFIEEEGVKNLACVVRNFSVFFQFIRYFEVAFFQIEIFCSFRVTSDRR